MTTATATKEAKASAPPAKPDLTMTRDPAAIWPDATACPDFPLGGRDGALTRAEAEDRLRQLSARLNGDGPLRAPSEIERAEAVELHFTPAPSGVRFPVQAMFDALGFEGFIPTHGDKRADLIAKATHLRGYLRKLDAMAEQTKEATQRRTESGARRRLDAWEGYIESLEADAKGLAEGAARYRQFLADRGAHYRLMTMRSEVLEVQKEAIAAAEELGETPPALPGWVDEICKDA